MNYRLRSYSLQDIGQRANQQDCFFPTFKEPCQFSGIDRDMVYYDGVPHTDDRLFILCDGMGGHDFGEVASQKVTWALSRSLLKSSTLEGEFDDNLMQQATSDAQKALNESKEGSHNMGTTMAVLKFHANGATVGHIGDSRVYQFRPAREGQAARVLFCTNDHHLPDRPNVLTRALMAYHREAPEVEIDHITDIKAGDIFMLCSDGIVENLTDDQLLAILTNPNYDDAERVERLLLECRDHTDNHTATIIRIKDVLNPDSMMGYELPLSEGTVLKSENYTYHLEKVLGEGSFGITYLAGVHIDMKGQMGSIHTEVKVTVKEFAMGGRMRRVGSELQITTGEEEVKTFREKFRSEATKLAMLSHPNIVRILEVFEANGTVYYSMEYLPDGNLGDYACIRSGLPEKEAIKYIRQVGSALSYIHANRMLHLDVKPDNIMRQGDSTVKLIDFGIARDYSKGGESPGEENSGIGTHGFAPPEQIDKSVPLTFSPCLDVYALGATYYKLLAAFNPNGAHDVAKHGLDLHPLHAKKVSKKSVDAIIAAMQPDPSKRLKTVDEFLGMLPRLEEKDDFKVEKHNTGFPWRILGGIIALVIIFIVLVMLLL